MDSESTRSSIKTGALKGHLSEAIDDSPCTMCLHQKVAIHHDFGASWGHTWMHRDGPIEDRTTWIKGNHGPYDVASCLQLARDVDESELSDQDRMGGICGIVGSWSTIIK